MRVLYMTLTLVSVYFRWRSIFRTLIRAHRETKILIKKSQKMTHKHSKFLTYECLLNQSLRFLRSNERTLSDPYSTHKLKIQDVPMSLWTVIESTKILVCFAIPLTPFLQRTLEVRLEWGCCTWFRHSYRRTDDSRSILWTLFRFQTRKQKHKKTSWKHTHKSSKHSSDYHQIDPTITILLRSSTDTL
jgi:hypothetical protein